jgi:redox-sensitive bicupin YhaK (pirin superfamily)
MTRRLGAAAAALGAVLLVGIYVLPSAAQEPPPPIAGEVLTDRAVFTDGVSLQLRVKLDGRATGVVNVKDASRVVTVRFTVQPGASFPWHTHHGPVVVNVVEGELVYVSAKDCVERPYPAGTAFIDTGDDVHTAFNPTGQPTVLVATFFGAPAEGPLVVHAHPGDC